MKNILDYDYTIAIAGNPNVGKSTIFNSLTGLHQHTGNWTGKTVENASGTFIYKNKKFLLIDIPGTYSLMADSEEEKIARDYINSNKANLTIIVVDATRLERNLNLVYQIMNLTNNIIVCVNLLDEAKNKGITIDLEKLSNLLGVPVIGTIARKKKTLNNLKETIFNFYNENLSITANKIKYSDNFLNDIFEKAHYITSEVCTIKNNNYNEKDKKIDKIVTSKKFGIPLMILFFCIIFWLTIVGANYPSQILSNVFEILPPYLIKFLNFINAPNWIISLLIDGVYKTVTWIISVMLPPMTIFFPLFTFLEDLGYLPRIAFNLDKCFQKCRCSGKQALTMCMGFGCNAAGVIGCRIISSSRERIIAILTNSFVPCNGRFPFLITIASIFFSGVLYNGENIFSSIITTLIVFSIILLGIGFTFLVSYILSKTILKGKNENTLIELPPYRKPQLGKILIYSIINRTLFVLGRAIIVAIPAGIIIWLLSNIYIGNLTLITYIANFFNPLAKIMGLDGYILTAFLLALPANEIVLPIILMCYTNSSSLVDINSITDIYNILITNKWTIITALNVMIFSLMHFPCGTTLLTIKKETKSLKWTILAFLLPTLLGIILCIITNTLYNLFVYLY